VDIRVDRVSDVPLHEQVAAQIVLMIGTGRLKPGTALPSVRALAQRLGIHRNTISRAYHDLTLNLLVEKRAGRKLMVYQPETAGGDAKDLDDLIAVTIAEARRQGHSLHQLCERLLVRVRSAPPDRLLVIARDAGLRMLFARELSERFTCHIATCDPAELRSYPERATGAIIVTPPGYMRTVRAVLPRDHPAIAITYSAADDLLDTLRKTAVPSIVAVVSVSQFFLDMADALLAPVAGRHHSVQAYLVGGKVRQLPTAADVIVCDVLAASLLRRQRRNGTSFVHRVIAPPCMEKIEKMMISSPPAEGRASKRQVSSVFRR
jgi:DNA-binding transcriptional regulator YhcF (GntR family)